MTWKCRSENESWLEADGGPYAGPTDKNISADDPVRVWVAAFHFVTATVSTVGCVAPPPPPPSQSQDHFHVRYNFNLNYVSTQIYLVPVYFQFNLNLILI